MFFILVPYSEAARNCANQERPTAAQRAAAATTSAAAASAMAAAAAAAAAAASVAPALSSSLPTTVPTKDTRGPSDDGDPTAHDFNSGNASSRKREGFGATAMAAAGVDVASRVHIMSTGDSALTGAINSGAATAALHGVPSSLLSASVGVSPARAAFAVSLRQQGPSGGTALRSTDVVPGNREARGADAGGDPRHENESQGPEAGERNGAASGGVGDDGTGGRRRGSAGRAEDAAMMAAVTGGIGSRGGGGGGGHREPADGRLSTTTRGVAEERREDGVVQVRSRREARGSGSGNGDLEEKGEGGAGGWGRDDDVATAGTFRNGEVEEEYGGRRRAGAAATATWRQKAAENVAGQDNLKTASLSVQRRRSSSNGYYDPVLGSTGNNDGLVDVGVVDRPRAVVMGDTQRRPATRTAYKSSATSVAAADAKTAVAPGGESLVPHGTSAGWAFATTAPSSADNDFAAVGRAAEERGDGGGGTRFGDAFSSDEDGDGDDGSPDRRRDRVVAIVKSNTAATSATTNAIATGSDNNARGGRGARDGADDANDNTGGRGVHDYPTAGRDRGRGPLSGSRATAAASGPTGAALALAESESEVATATVTTSRPEKAGATAPAIATTTTTTTAIQKNSSFSSSASSCSSWDVEQDSFKTPRTAEPATNPDGGLAGRSHALDEVGGVRAGAGVGAPEPVAMSQATSVTAFVDEVGGPGPEMSGEPSTEFAAARRDVVLGSFSGFQHFEAKGREQEVPPAVVASASTVKEPEAGGERGRGSGSGGGGGGGWGGVGIEAEESTVRKFDDWDEDDGDNG